FHSRPCPLRCTVFPYTTLFRSLMYRRRTGGAGIFNPRGRLEAQFGVGLQHQRGRKILRREAGVEMPEHDLVDEIVLGHFNAGFSPQDFTASLVLQADPKLRFKPATRVENACATGSAAVHQRSEERRVGEDGTSEGARPAVK